MKNIIAYCLYGSSNKYLHGIIEAVISYKIHFIGWTIRVYICSTLKEHKVVEILNGLDVEILFINQKSTKEESNEMMYYRFTPMFENDVKYFLSRDADSRADAREFEMVQNFIKSGKTLHSILDQGCHHGIMGGAFAVDVEKLRQYNLKSFNDYIDPRIQTEGFVRRGSDQTWLRMFFSPVVNKYDAYVSLNEDVIARNEQRGIQKKDIKLLNNISIVDCEHDVTKHCSNFVGRQNNVDNSPNDIKARNSVYIPITF
jgi:hypothetical protein